MLPHKSSCLAETLAGLKGVPWTQATHCVSPGGAAGPLLFSAPSGRLTRLPTWASFPSQYQFTANFLEIYNESLRDLLVLRPERSCELEIKRVKQSTEELHVPNLSYVPVTSEGEVPPSFCAERGGRWEAALGGWPPRPPGFCQQRLFSPGQVLRLLQTAKSNRSVARTILNERSSRSHSLFQLHIEGRHASRDAHTSCESRPLCRGRGGGGGGGLPSLTGVPLLQRC